MYTLRRLSPQANYTDRRATTACRRSSCQLLRVESVAWSAQRIPTAVNLGFPDQTYVYTMWTKCRACGWWSMWYIYLPLCFTLVEELQIVYLRWDAIEMGAQLLCSVEGEARGWAQLLGTSRCVVVPWTGVEWTINRTLQCAGAQLFRTQSVITVRCKRTFTLGGIWHKF
jgi:hypothetical protein